ncbi:hypothetical protein Tco_0271292 [Tanacetum coccineum]
MAGSKTSSQGILLVIQAINHSWLWQRSTRGLIFYTKLCLKETQGVSITDCHAGNPCELPSDLTANNDLPIIEELYGQDQKERGKQPDYLSLWILAFGRETYHGRVSKDYYWLISNKPELLISSIEPLSFCLAEAEG